MKTRRILALAALLTSTLALPMALAADKIVVVASGDAVAAGGLISTLQSPGPFTVFAATDEAFGKLSAGTAENLLKLENKERVVAILTYRVVAGNVMTADVQTVKTISINRLESSLETGNGRVMGDNANVVQTDVAASNGVIHVIDTVVRPN